MKRWSIRKGMSLIFAAFAVLAAFAVSLGLMVERVDAAALENRWQQLRINAEIVCDHIDDYVAADQDWGEYDYAGDYSASVARLDAWHGTFAAMYDEYGGLLTERVTMAGEVGVDPWSHDGFVDAVRANDSGEVYVPSIIQGGVTDLMRMYYRWIPTGDYEHKLLFVVGLDHDALIDSPTVPLARWCAALLAAAAIAVAVSLIALTHHHHDVVPREEHNA